MKSNNRICFLRELAWLLGCSQPRVCIGVRECTSICGMFAMSSHFCFLLQLHPVLAPSIPLPACESAPGMPSNSSAVGRLSLPMGLASLFVEEKIIFGWEQVLVLHWNALWNFPMENHSQGIPGTPRPPQKLKRPQWNIHKPWWFHIWQILRAVSSALKALNWFLVGLGKQRLIATYSLFWQSPAETLGKYYCNEELTDI